MIRRPPRSTRTDTLFPYTTLFRSVLDALEHKLPKSFAHLEAAREEILAFTVRSEEHTSELQSLMRISYAVFCLKKKKTEQHTFELQQNMLIKYICYSYKKTTTN